MSEVEDSTVEVDKDDPRFARLPNSEVSEYITVEKWRKKLENGEEVPEKIKELLEATDIDLDTLLNTTPDKMLMMWIKSVVPKATMVAVHTPEVVVEMRYYPDTVTVDTIVYPVEDGVRIGVEALKTTERTRKFRDDGTFSI